MTQGGRSGRPSILVMMGAFWPNNDASGPNQSLKSLATALGPWFDFRIVARDRPFGAGAPMAGSGEWHERGFARVRYCETGRAGARDLREILSGTPHDILWLNGFFDREFTLPALRLRRMGRIPRMPAIVSPRGEFGPGALGLKSGRKQLYIRALHWLGLLRDVTLHATSDAEAADIRAALPWVGKVAVAPNLRALLPRPDFIEANDALRIAFVGRVSPVKQLHYALDVLARVKARVNFDIYGPAQDEAYWRRCESQIATLPTNISVKWHGETPNEAIVAAIALADLFFLPTAGENFGHAIFEALCCGTPLLISDQTPWRDLESARAGWDLPLANPNAFAATIERFAALPPSARGKWRDGARAMAESWFERSDGVTRNRAFLMSLLSEGAAQ